MERISKIDLFFVSDERDAIQKKTFTKWVNKHLKKVREIEKKFHFICKWSFGQKSLSDVRDTKNIYSMKKKFRRGLGGQRIN